MSETFLHSWKPSPCLWKSCHIFAKLAICAVNRLSLQKSWHIPSKAATPQNIVWVFEKVATSWKWLSHFQRDSHVSKKVAPSRKRLGTHLRKILHLEKCAIFSRRLSHLPGSRKNCHRFKIVAISSRKSLSPRDLACLRQSCSILRKFRISPNNFPYLRESWLIFQEVTCFLTKVCPVKENCHLSVKDGTSSKGLSHLRESCHLSTEVFTSCKELSSHGKSCQLT
jgi:hypothetical protein